MLVGDVSRGSRHALHRPAILLGGVPCYFSQSTHLSIPVFFNYSRSRGRCQDLFSRPSAQTCGGPPPRVRTSPGNAGAAPAWAVSPPRARRRAQERPRRNFRRGPVMQTVSILSLFAPVTNRFTRNQIMPREKLPKSKHRNHHANTFLRSAASCSAFEPPHLQVVQKEPRFVNAGLSCQRRAMRRPAGSSGILPSRTVFRLIPFPYRLKPWSNGLRLPGLLILVPAHWIHSLLKKSPISSRCLPLVFLPAARAAHSGKTGTDLLSSLSSLQLYYRRSYGLSQ